MIFVPDDEENPAVTFARLDLAAVAALLSQVPPEGDSYEVLRDVLTRLSEQSRERGSTH